MGCGYWRTRGDGRVMQEKKRENGGQRSGESEVKYSSEFRSRLHSRYVHAIGHMLIFTDLICTNLRK